MTNVQKYEVFEDAVTAFETESKPILKTYMQHLSFSPKANKTHHKKARSVGANNHRSKKPGGRRY